MVNFGDVVCQIKDRVVRAESGLKYYLGGEHFDNAELHIRRKGIIAQDPIGPAFHMRFKPGQMLIVSRNPHLRKASLVDFEGICANTTYVCQAIEAKALPSFLPFIMQSDSFWYSAEVNKRGSTNPYLNWGDFAKFQFKLPPLEEQKRFADLLWSIDKTMVRYREAKDALLVYASAIFNTGISGDKKSLLTIGDLIDSVEYGLSEKMTEKAKYPVLRMNNLKNGQIDLANLKYIDLERNEAVKYMLQPDDILFNRTNSFDLVGKTSIFKEKGEYLYASYLLRLRVNRRLVMPEYLNYYMNSELGMSHIRKYRTPGVSQSNINSKNLLKVVVSMFPLSGQKEIVSILNEIEMILMQIDRCNQDCRQIINTIINKVVGD